MIYFANSRVLHDNAAVLPRNRSSSPDSSEWGKQTYGQHRKILVGCWSAIYEHIHL